MNSPQIDAEFLSAQKDHLSKYFDYLAVLSLNDGSLPLTELGGYISLDDEADAEPRREINLNVAWLVSNGYVRLRKEESGELIVGLTELGAAVAGLIAERREESILGQWHDGSPQPA